MGREKVTQPHSILSCGVGQIFFPDDFRVIAGSWGLVFDDRIRSRFAFIQDFDEQIGAELWRRVIQFQIHARAAVIEHLGDTAFSLVAGAILDDSRVRDSIRFSIIRIFSGFHTLLVLAASSGGTRTRFAYSQSNIYANN